MRRDERLFVHYGAYEVLSGRKKTGDHSRRDGAFFLTRYAWFPETIWGIMYIEE